MSELPTIQVLPDGVHISSLVCDDTAVIDYLGAHEPAVWPSVLRDMLAVGARGLVGMGVATRLEEIDARVRDSVSGALDDASASVETLMAATRDAIRLQLDPEIRSSAMGVTLDRLGALREEMVRALDVDHATSVSAGLVGRLSELLGPDGAVEDWMRQQLDQENPDSPMGRLTGLVERRFDELRDAIRSEKIAEEHRLGSTLKGFDYEDRVEDRLRSLAAGLGGAIVERTSLAGGMLRSDAKVGDFVLQLEDGTRIVVEAKHTERISVGGREGMLTQLDRAMANRQADAAICVSATDAFPAEVGSFSVHGKRVLCVDDGTGTLLGVAIRVLKSLLVAEGRQVGLDPATLADRIDRIQGLARRFSSAKATLSKASSSIGDVQDLLDEIRAELLDHTGELATALSRGTAQPTTPPALRSA